MEKITTIEGTVLEFLEDRWDQGATATGPGSIQDRTKLKGDTVERTIKSLISKHLVGQRGPPASPIYFITVQGKRVLKAGESSIEDVPDGDHRSTSSKAVLSAKEKGYEPETPDGSKDGDPPTPPADPDPPASKPEGPRAPERFVCEEVLPNGQKCLRSFETKNALLIHKGRAHKPPEPGEPHTLDKYPEPPPLPPEPPSSPQEPAPVPQGDAEDPLDLLPEADLPDTIKAIIEGLEARAKAEGYAMTSRVITDRCACRQMMHVELTLAKETPPTCER